VSGCGSNFRTIEPARMIKLVAHRSDWASDFSVEARRILESFGASALRIDHVGSTAVPGLLAKPVIDIQVSVLSLNLFEPRRELLEQLGYQFVPLGEFDKVYPFFTRPQQWPSTHHVHLCEAGSAVERDHLAFRDYLRAHADVARQYEALKLKLAARHHGRDLASREMYSLGKSGFVRHVLALAAADSQDARVMARPG
jgi:GrpB-like predicted nucleotidyltransferase (UPF0157 family)